MKLKLIFLLLNFSVICHSVFSQKLIFCENVAQNGRPLGTSNSFQITKEGGYVCVVYSQPESFTTDSLHFEVYHNGIYFKTFSSKVEKEWDYFYQRIKFIYEGIYTVYILNSEGKELVFDKLQIIKN